MSESYAVSSKREFKKKIEFSLKNWLSRHLGILENRKSKIDEWENLIDVVQNKYYLQKLPQIKVSMNYLINNRSFFFFFFFLILCCELQAFGDTEKMILLENEELRKKELEEKFEKDKEYRFQEKQKKKRELENPDIDGLIERHQQKEREELDLQKKINTLREISERIENDIDYDGGYAYSDDILTERNLVGSEIKRTGDEDLTKRTFDIPDIKFVLTPSTAVRKMSTTPSSEIVDDSFLSEFINLSNIPKSQSRPSSSLATNTPLKLHIQDRPLPK
jgi:hypothetical protein